MPIPRDDDPVMIDGWYAMLRMQERGRVNARRLAYAMILRPFPHRIQAEIEGETHDNT